MFINLLSLLLLYWHQLAYANPLSETKYFRDIKTSKTLEQDFMTDYKLYISTLDPDYLSKLQFICDGNLKNNLNSETDEKKAMIPMMTCKKFEITNNNDHDYSGSDYDGILYFVDAGQDADVYDINVNPNPVVSNKINKVATIISTIGGILIRNISNSFSSQPKIVIGGIGDLDNDDCNLQRNKEHFSNDQDIYILSPMITIKQHLINSEVALTTKPFSLEDNREQIEIEMKWKEYNVLMSPNYMTLNKTRSIRYVAYAEQPNSKFDVNIYGSLTRDSSITLSSYGYAGTSSIKLTSNQTNGVKTLYGDKLMFSYDRSQQDLAEGFFATVVCTQSSGTIYLLGAIAFTLLRML